MSLSITLSLTVCLLSPQDQPATETPAALLAKGDQESLRSKVQDYFKARTANQSADDARREGTRKREEAAKDKLRKDWDGKSAKKNILGNAVDLRAIFTNCFEFERQYGTGDLRNIKTKDWPTYDLVLPKKYRADVPMPTVLVLRGQDDKGWTSPLDWYAATWKSAVEAGDFTLVLPALDNAIDFDPVVDLTKPEGEAADLARRLAVWGTLGGLGQALNLDRDRIYLDCGKGSGGYAFRIATYAPHFFAGVVIRYPTDPGDLRLDSLAGVPFLLLRSPETKDVCDRLAEALNKLAAGTATVLDAKGAYPHADSASDIAAWCHGRARNLLRPHVVVANTHDVMKRAFWASMGTAESLTVPVDQRPRLEVVADRGANKVTVTCRGVSDFTLLLSDAFLDLDKEITAIINGKAQPPFKVDRSLNKLLDNVFKKRDPGMLFSTEKTFVVPVEKADKSKDAKGDSPTPK